MTLREYAPADCPLLACLFYHTVHSVNAADYSPPQLDAWATGQVDLPAWNASFLSHHTVIAEDGGVILGFGDMDGGYLDRLYVHKDYQRRGIAGAIADALEGRALANGIFCFTTHASITARPFFEKRGYTLVRQNTVLRRNVELINFTMEKRL